MKRWSKSLIIWDMQIKTAIRYYLPFTSKATIKKAENNMSKTHCLKADNENS